MQSEKLEPSVSWITEPPNHGVGVGVGVGSPHVRVSSSHPTSAKQLIGAWCLETHQIVDVGLVLVDEAVLVAGVGRRIGAHERFGS